MSRRFVAFVCTGRGTHNERRLRRFRWERVADTMSAGPGTIVGAGDIEAWNNEVELMREQIEAGVTHHLIEDATARVVDGVPMSYLGDGTEHVRATMGEAQHGTRVLLCRTCRPTRNVPLRPERIEAIVRGFMDADRWVVDISDL
jgi:hypothetical protein